MVTETVISIWHFVANRCPICEKGWLKDEKRDMAQNLAAEAAAAVCLAGVVVFAYLSLSSYVRNYHCI